MEIEDSRKRGRADREDDERELEGNERDRALKQLKLEGVDFFTYTSKLMLDPFGRLIVLGRDEVVRKLFLDTDVHTLHVLCSLSKAIRAYCRYTLGAAFWRAVALGDFVFFVPFKPKRTFIYEFLRRVIDENVYEMQFCQNW